MIKEELGFRSGSFYFFDTLIFHHKSLKRNVKGHNTFMPFVPFVVQSGKDSKFLLTIVFCPSLYKLLTLKLNRIPFGASRSFM